jgi:voltage-gated potassium channel
LELGAWDLEFGAWALFKTILILNKMLASILLLLKFIVDIFKRLFKDPYYRSLGLVLLLILIAGTLFYWLAQGRSFLQALSFSVATMAMNSPYGIEWGPTSVAGVLFHLIYMFLSVGIFLLFVLETGKTMVHTYDEFYRKMVERKELKKTKKQTN